MIQMHLRTDSHNILCPGPKAADRGLAQGRLVDAETVHTAKSIEKMLRSTTRSYKDEIFGVL